VGWMPEKMRMLTPFNYPLSEARDADEEGSTCCASRARSRLAHKATPSAPLRRQEPCLAV